MKHVLVVAAIVIAASISHARAATSWKDGQGCAYSEILIGQNAATSHGPDAFVNDIREIVDSRGTTIGYLYVTDKGYAIEGNALMAGAVRRRFHLATIPGVFSSIEPTTLAAVGKSAVPCRPEHRTRAGASPFRIKRDQSRAYSSGRDYLPDPSIDLFPSR